MVFGFRTFCLPSSKLCRLIFRYFSFSLFAIACLKDSCFIGILGSADRAPNSVVLIIRLLPSCVAIAVPFISCTVGVFVFIMSKSCCGVFCWRFFCWLFGGMYFVFTITVPFGFSMCIVRVVSRISKPIMMSALPVSISGVCIFSLIFV